MGYLDDLYLNAYTPPVEAGGPWSGTNSADTLSYWLASDPLVEQQGGGVTWAANGTPTLADHRGVQAFTCDGGGYYRSANCTSGISAGDPVTVYVVCEATNTGPDLANKSITSIEAGAGGGYSRYNLKMAKDADLQANARVSGAEVNDFDLSTGSSGTAYVLSAEFTESGGTFYVELGIDGTQTGSPGTRGGSNTGPYTDIDEIGDGGGGILGDHATGGEVKIWARLVQKAAFSSTVVTELQTALGLS